MGGGGEERGGGGAEGGGGDDGGGGAGGGGPQGEEGSRWCARGTEEAWRTEGGNPASSPPRSGCLC